MQCDEIRERIVAESISYVGVKFCHQGRSRRGVDCAGLLYCVFNQIIQIGEDYCLYPDQLKSGMVFRNMRSYGDRITKAGAGPGDVVLMRFCSSSTHLGILVNNDIIHADRYIGRVVRTPMTVSSILYNNGRVVAYFRIKGVPAWHK